MLGNKGKIKLTYYSNWLFSVFCGRIHSSLNMAVTFLLHFNRSNIQILACRSPTVLPYDLFLQELEGTDDCRLYPVPCVIMTERVLSRNTNHNSYEHKQKAYNHSFFDIAWPRNIAPLFHPHRFCTPVADITAVKLRFDAISTQNELKYKGRGYISRGYSIIPRKYDTPSPPPDCSVPQQWVTKLPRLFVWEQHSADLWILNLHFILSCRKFIDS